MSATTNREIDGQIPNYPSLPPQLVCQLHNVTMHVSIFISFAYDNRVMLVCLQSKFIELECLLIFRQMLKQMKCMLK